MARYDNGYSRAVALAKVVLPLAALVILSTLFLVSQRIDPDQAVPYSTAEVDEILREQRVERPRYSGVARDGAAIAVAAQSARPMSESQDLTADGLTARIDTPDGGWVKLAAGEGRIAQDQTSVRMEGAVRIQSATGLDVTTDALTADLGTATFVTDGPIEAQSPMGRITGGRLRLDRAAAVPGAAEDAGPATTSGTAATPDADPAGNPSTPAPVTSEKPGTQAASQAERSSTAAGERAAESVDAARGTATDPNAASEAQPLDRPIDLDQSDPAQSDASSSDPGHSRSPAAAPYVLDFTDGVRLVYLPAERQEGDAP
ncbi:LPS export ABC transporter periplasmic protein LptC [Mesobaculum littorinae]|uniref:LPS export ABC transporter periplasmic protein LptC n=1 Tax=Mesobaculum littorinae TaxID=2486419 RepID=A0A438AGM1_9RHOB|nr:LPS export ABC transporter periplasmic protein LptC [Mesobaculum littorinae]RVV97856.1 LPS export ABC transporter periplasmic protein LptC [Mesobaculum littorinae]